MLPSRQHCRVLHQHCREWRRQWMVGARCGRRCWRRWHHPSAKHISTAVIDPQTNQLRRTQPFCSAETWTSSAPSSLPAGADPVGIGGNIPGFGDQREIELLVEAGFAPVQAIRIGTLNGAIFLGRRDQIGSIAIGKNADLVVMKGDPASRITDIENVEIVFKDGVGYDTKKLLDSVKGHYGEY